MENEENRGLIDKKAYEDQFVTFFHLIFGALSLFSLSLSLFNTSSFLGALCIGSRKENKARGRKEQARTRRIKQLD